ncbi:MAG: GNAT family N-acetyltransferase [Candidatus Aenigmarchaeota archaeon]|nr:GNAT family N-acetyltransferase [Candidatus Aenigmarchaeota archaeon]
MALTFRKATMKDWRTVSVLEESASGSNTYVPITAEAEVKGYVRKSRIFLILDGRKPVGTVSYEVKAPGHAHIDGLTVAPGHQRQGIASKAMAFLMKELEPFPRVDLVVHPHNTVAVRLYLKYGFHIEGWKENHFGDGEPRIVLVKEQKPRKR